MSDIGANVEPTTEAPPADTGSEVEDDYSAPLSDDQTTFDRTYVEKIRREAAKYRTAAKKYEAFEGIEDDDLEVFATWASDYKTGGLDALAGSLRFQLEQMTPEQQEAVTDAIEDAQEDEGRVLTQAEIAEVVRKEIEEARNAEKYQADQAAAIAELKADTEALGYEIGSKEQKALWALASGVFEGDLDAAHAFLSSRGEAAVKDFVDSKAEEARRSPTFAQGQGAVQRVGEKPKYGSKEWKALGRVG